MHKLTRAPSRIRPCWTSRMCRTLLVPFCIQITMLFFLKSGILSFFVLFILIHKSEYVSVSLPYGIIDCETDEVLCIRFYVFRQSAQN